MSKIDFKEKGSGSSGVKGKKQNVAAAVKIATKGINAAGKAKEGTKNAESKGKETVNDFNSVSDEVQDVSSEFSDSKKYYEKMYNTEKKQFKKAESRVYNKAKEKISKKIREKITQKTEKPKGKKEIEVRKNSVPKNPDVSVKGQNRTNFDVKSGINQPINNVPAKGTGIVKAPGASASSSAACASTGVSTATSSSTGVATTATGTTATAASTGTATGAVTGTAAGTTTATATGTTAATTAGTTATAGATTATATGSAVATTAGTTAATVATGTAATTVVGTAGAAATTTATATVSVGSVFGPLGLIIVVVVFFLMMFAICQTILSMLTSFAGFTPGVDGENADYVWATADDVKEAWDDAWWQKLEFQIAAAEDNVVNIRYNTASWDYILSYYNVGRFYGVKLTEFLNCIGFDGVYEENSDGVKIERIIQDHPEEVINSLIDEDLSPAQFAESMKAEMDYFILYAEDLTPFIRYDFPEETPDPETTVETFSSIITGRLYDIVYNAYHGDGSPSTIIIDVDYSLPAYISMLKGEDIEDVLDKLFYLYKDSDGLHVTLSPDWKTTYELTENEINSYEFVKSNYDLPSMEVGTKLEDFVDIDNLAPPAPPPEAPSTGNPDETLPGEDISAPSTSAPQG